MAGPFLEEIPENPADQAQLESMLGSWHVTTVTTDPSFQYDPELLNGTDESEEEFSLPPGPNNPVGLVWIGINKEHYGIHGTPEPTKISHDESSGCVCLTNWDAQELARWVIVGTAVRFEE